MKKVLLVTASLIALGATAPAVAADLAARPYTKAPPMVAAVYDWSGFYIGANGGWGSSRNSWDFVCAVWSPRARHDATGGTVGGQVGYRWQAGTWVFGLEAQGNWADFSGSNVEPAVPAASATARKIDAFGLFTGQVGYAVNNVLLYVKGGAAVTSNKYRINTLPAARSLASPATTPAGAARSAPASNTPSLRTGRSASSTITCSCRTVPTTSPRRPASPSAPIASVRTSISSPPA